MPLRHRRYFSCKRKIRDTQPTESMMRLMSVLRNGLAVLAALAAATACTHHQGRGGAASSAGTPTAGTVSGTFLEIGGPAPGVHQPLTGTIEFHAQTQAGPVATTVTTAADGSFHARVSPGLYVLIGHSPDVTGPVCMGTEPVTVTEAQQVRAEVICAVP